MFLKKFDFFQDFPMFMASLEFLEDGKQFHVRTYKERKTEIQIERKVERVSKRKKHRKKNRDIDRKKGRKKGRDSI